MLRLKKIQYFYPPLPDSISFFSVFLFVHWRYFPPCSRFYYLLSPHTHLPHPPPPTPPTLTFPCIFQVCPSHSLSNSHPFLPSPPPYPGCHIDTPTPRPGQNTLSFAVSLHPQPSPSLQHSLALDPSPLPCSLLLPPPPLPITLHPGWGSIKSERPNLLSSPKCTIYIKKRSQPPHKA